MAFKLSAIKPNPDNPRLIKDYRFFALLRSVFEFPKALAIRPVAYDGDGIVQGGNMRYKAFEHIVKTGVKATIQQIIEKTRTEHDGEEWEQNLHDVGESVWKQVVKTKSVPDNWVADISHFTAEEIERFMVVDNVGYGEWDWPTIANETFANFPKWASWGFQTPAWIKNDEADDDYADEEDQPQKEKKSKIILKFTDDEYTMVKEALAKIAKTPEQAVWQLLGLEGAENTPNVL